MSDYHRDRESIAMIELRDIERSLRSDRGNAMTDRESMLNGAILCLIDVVREIKGGNAP